MLYFVISSFSCCASVQDIDLICFRFITFVVLNPQVSYLFSKYLFQSQNGPYVRYGLSASNLSLTAYPYNATNGYPGWTSGVIYRVHLTGLATGVDYFYRVVSHKVNFPH